MIRMFPRCTVADQIKGKPSAPILLSVPGDNALQNDKRLVLFILDIRMAEVSRIDFLEILRHRKAY